MAITQLARASEYGTKLAELTIDYSLWNEDAWIKKNYTYQGSNRPLLVYRNPCIFYGGGVYDFPEGGTGYYSSTGVDKLTVNSGFRYKWISYWALDNDGMRQCGLSEDTQREIFGLSGGYLDSLGADVLVNLGMGSFIPSGGIPLYNVNAVMALDAFSELTPADGELNRYPYVIDLFQDLYKIGAANPQVNNSIWATQLSFPNSSAAGFIGGAFNYDNKTLTLLARQCYIVNENVPNICPQPFECFYTKGVIQTQESGLGSNISVCNISYLGVEAV